MVWERLLGEGSKWNKGSANWKGVKEKVRVLGAKLIYIRLTFG